PALSSPTVQGRGFLRAGCPSAYWPAYPHTDCLTRSHVHVDIRAVRPPLRRPLRRSTLCPSPRRHARTHMRPQPASAPPDRSVRGTENLIRGRNGAEGVASSCSPPGPAWGCPIAVYEYAGSITAVLRHHFLTCSGKL